MTSSQQTPQQAAEYHAHGTIYNKTDDASHVRKQSFLAGVEWEKQRSQKLLEAVGELVDNTKRRINWLIGCGDAALSNMEGADAKEFKYWEKWMMDCADQVRLETKALAAFEKFKAEN